MYTLSSYWNPKITPNDYVQCIAFAYMAYNMANRPIRKVSGNAIAMAGKDWRCKYYNDGGCAEWSLVNNLVYLDQFEVYESGVSTEIPQVGDLMVWRERPPAGHVGIISGIKGNSLLISNSNSNNTSHVFKYILDEDNRITLLSKDGTSFGWIPIWWARKK